VSERRESVRLLALAAAAHERARPNKQGLSLARANPTCPRVGRSETQWSSPLPVHDRLRQGQDEDVGAPAPLLLAAGRLRGAHDRGPVGVINKHERVTFSRWTLLLAFLAVGLPCVAAVIVFGELSTGALLAVGGTALLVSVVGLTRRVGEAAPPIGHSGLAWLAWLAAGLTWEFFTLLDDDVPTVSDLADPVLAHPPMRAAATLAWLIAGAWLLTRPRHHPQQP
jgi:hypothetical protein